MDTPKRNEKAVALFKEHLPPHLAELVIKEHEYSCGIHNGEEYLDVEVTTCEEALVDACFWSGREDRFIDLQSFFMYVDGNTFRAEIYYTAYPEHRPEAAILDIPPVTGEVPYEVIDELQEHRAAELSAASNAEDTRDAMHSNEPPKVGTDVVIRDIYKDMHQLFQDAHQQINRVHYDVVKLREIPDQKIIDRLYEVYCSYVRGSSAIWNPIMRTNDDGSLSMFTRAEFADEYVWIMPRLSFIVACEDYAHVKKSIWRTDESNQHRWNNVNSNLGVMAQEQRLERSNVRAKLEQILTVTQSEEDKASSTKSLVISVGIFVVIDIIIHIINLFI